MSFEVTLNESFPGSIPDKQFIDAGLRVAAPHGFTAENTLACVGVCRDEICQPLVLDVHRAWGEAFMLAGLGGMLFCGRTGLQAAHHHAPIHEGRERYAYICMPHIGIGPDGEPGRCVRPTRQELSSACGALVALHGRLQQGQVDHPLDPTDPEQSMLAQRLAGAITPGRVPGLVKLTKLARAAIAADLEGTIKDTVDTDKSDYCVFTGVQVHAPDGRTFVWPSTSYAVVRGRRHDFDLNSAS